MLFNLEFLVYKWSDILPNVLVNEFFMIYTVCDCVPRQMCKAVGELPGTQP